MTVDIKKLDGSEVEITGEIAAVDFESFRHEAMEEFRRELELPGFRKGHAPDNLLIEKVGNEKILYEMAEHALSHYYPEILKENQIDAIGRPEITITKIAADNPLGFKIKTAVMPEIKLPDYQKIAKTENKKPAESIEPTEEEVNTVLEEIRQSRAPKHEHKEGAASAGGTPKQEAEATKGSGEPKEEHKPASATGSGEAKEGDEKSDLPELNDEFAKALGAFESLADLKTKIKENLAHEKVERAKEKKRLAIMEEIIAQTKLDLPKTLVDGEAHKMEHDLREQLESMGLKFDDYLAHLKKTIEDLRKDWEPEATKRAKFGLLLTEIAKAEKISADPTNLEQEVKQVMEHYPAAEPTRVRAYAENMLANEGVFKFLENLK